MALIDITPVMTSNNTPSPYVVTASSVLNSTYQPYRVFDSNSNTIYHSALGAQQWIKIDFGSIMKISAFSMSATTDMSFNGTPKYFILYGSNDDLIYEKIHQEENEINWIAGETRLYKLSQEVSFRYYKLSIVSTVTYNYVTITEIGFYQDDGITPTENSKTVSRRYTLPFGSKLRLDNLTSDLTYMLATEDDGENEGTLRIVNHAGKFIVPKAGQKMDLLFDGNANTTGNFSLSKSINEYTSIRIIADMYSTSTNRNSISQDRTVTEILSKVGNDIVFSSTPASSIYRYITINFTNDTSFNVTEILKANGNPCIEKIYGIY